MIYLSKKSKKKEQEYIAKLFIKNKEILSVSIPVVVNQYRLPTIRYLEDPTEVHKLSFYNLVFEIKNLYQDGGKTVIEYHFKGVEPVES